ncbi:hypothetical protein B0T19DRAFT_406151 [Cercophora scortea]|uniref:Aminoacyl-transfer RNA synthetases class-II family profile domain-containing protein n=1 Tax=Cercophora scortea TaxID=314031 RepID=A0AAE0J287_9PEZI|nr:hypothetical protein B0T19DRAFT_406151 [Cercophora scortea]
MTTTTSSCLQFLRQYVWKPLVVGRANNNGGSLRFYRLPGQLGLMKRDETPEYPRIYPTNTTRMSVPAFRVKYEHINRGERLDEEVILHGRIQAVRSHGAKLLFLVLKSEFTEVQAMFNLHTIAGSTNVADIDPKVLSRGLTRGDIISVTGRPTRTPTTGELTIDATEPPLLLTPSLVPVPVKLADEDRRIKQRHMDLLVNRRTADTLRLRSYLIKYMRDFLHARDFLEVQTPILAENAGGAVARPFTTTMAGAGATDLALRIAPELWLKRLVIGGMDKVFELGPSFRNEGLDQTHNPEFTTCEFYSTYANLDDLIGLTEELVCGLAEHCQELIATKLDSLPAIDTSIFRRPFKQMEFIPAIQSAIGITLPDLSGPDALDTLVAELESHGIAVERPLPTLPKLLDRLAATHLEPHSAEAPLFITHQPVCMSPLSKSFVCPETGQTVSARAELFMGGRELVNMYEEENDPFAQRDKFIEQAKHRDTAADGASAVNADGELLIDENYVQALEAGLPPTGGWGCGVDRLVMLFAGTRRISDTLSFGNLRNVVTVSTLKRPFERDRVDVDVDKMKIKPAQGDSHVENSPGFRRLVIR